MLQGIPSLLNSLGGGIKMKEKTIEQKYRSLKTLIEKAFVKKKFVGESGDRTMLIEEYYQIIDGEGGKTNERKTN